MSQPKILVLDIETSPMEALVFERHDVNIGLDNIVKDWQIIAWSAKWLNKKHIEYYDGRNVTERQILTPLWHLLDEADIVITHNGQKFDSRRINARFVHYGMPPPSSYKHLDTYRIAKRIGDFTSSSLEYLSGKLCTKYKKLSHPKFPGISLWKECRKGTVEAWDEMKRYNIRDTLATEELYGKLKAWIPQTMPWVYYDKGVCRLCGPGTTMWHKGYEYKKSGRYHRYQCQSCYAWTTGGKI